MWPSIATFLTLGKIQNGADLRLNFSAEIPLSARFLLFMCINVLQQGMWVASSERHPGSNSR